MLSFPADPDNFKGFFPTKIPHHSVSFTHKSAVSELLLLYTPLGIFLGALGLEIIKHCSKRLCCIYHGALKRVRLEDKAVLHENIHTHYFIIHSRNDKLVCKNSVRCSLTISPTVKSLFTLFQTPL